MSKPKDEKQEVPINQGAQKAGNGKNKRTRQEAELSIEAKSEADDVEMDRLAFGLRTSSVNNRNAQAIGPASDPNHDLPELNLDDNGEKKVVNSELSQASAHRVKIAKIHPNNKGK